jgi:hypothetical protein
MPTFFIGLYLAIWTGGGLLGDQIPAAGLYVLADFFTYAYNLLVYIGLVTIFAKGWTWANPGAASTVYQLSHQPPISRQPVTTPMPGSGILQVQRGGQSHSVTPAGDEFVAQSMPIQRRQAQCSTAA